MEKRFQQCRFVAELLYEQKWDHPGKLLPTQNLTAVIIEQQESFSSIWLEDWLQGWSGKTHAMF